MGRQGHKKDTRAWLLTGWQQTGGWPLTMFLDPDTQLPFFGGTYFPKTPRFQLPGFTDLLLRISDAFGTRRGEFADHSAKVSEVMGEFKAGKLKSSSGKKVTKESQAVAIAMSEAGISKSMKNDEIKKFFPPEYQEYFTKAESESDELNDAPEDDDAMTKAFESLGVEEDER